RGGGDPGTDRGIINSARSRTVSRNSTTQRDVTRNDKTTLRKRRIVMLEQIVQIAGSLLILGAFVAAQTRRLQHDSWTYLVLNLVGSATLAVLALQEKQWGFLLLEGVWAIVSIAGVITKLRSPDKPSR
ncbi:hypothetical protein PYV02_12835, partial [Leifsonia sp. H3M29-4]|uniref:CBU_0592 family membrane protein n=1 Tax=Salinibacterium metalliresistens TaxID=3031321 RepID=UPI0023D9E376